MGAIGRLQRLGEFVLRGCRGEDLFDGTACRACEVEYLLGKSCCREGIPRDRECRQVCVRSRGNRFQAHTGCRVDKSACFGTDGFQT